MFDQLQNKLLPYNELSNNNLNYYNTNHIITLNDVELWIAANNIYYEKFPNLSIYIHSKTRSSLLDQTIYINEIKTYLLEELNIKLEDIFIIIYLVNDSILLSTKNGNYFADLDIFNKIVELLKLINSEKYIHDNLSKDNTDQNNAVTIKKPLKHFANVDITSQNNDSTNDSQLKYEKVRLEELKTIFSSIDGIYQTSNILASFAVKILFYMNINKLTRVDKDFYKTLLDHNEIKLTERGRMYCIRNVLRINYLREDMINSSNLRKLLADSMSSNDIELQYSACWCLWLFSYNTNLFENNGIFYIHRSILRVWINNLLSTSKVEKIVRINCFIILNIFEIEWIMEILVQQKIDYRYGLLQYEKWPDKDLNSLLHTVANKFRQNEAKLTSPERYLKELASGELTQGPMHTERFWSKNISIFENNQYQVISLLADKLEQSKNPTTLSLVLFDLGEFARLYPKSKLILEKFNVRNKVITLLDSKDKDIAKEALRTIQKIMLNNWMDIVDNAKE